MSVEYTFAPLNEGFDEVTFPKVYKSVASDILTVLSHTPNSASSSVVKMSVAFCEKPES